MIAIPPDMTISPKKRAKFCMIQQVLFLPYPTPYILRLVIRQTQYIVPGLSRRRVFPHIAIK